MAFYRTVWLSSLSLLNIPILPQTTENVLDNLGLMRRGRAAEDVELNVEPIVDTLVNSMVFCAEFFRCYAFFEGFGFGGSSVFVLIVLASFVRHGDEKAASNLLTEPQIYSVGNPRALL